MADPAHTDNVCGTLPLDSDKGGQGYGAREYEPETRQDLNPEGSTGPKGARGGGRARLPASPRGADPAALQGSSRQPRTRSPVRPPGQTTDTVPGPQGVLGNDDDLEEWRMQQRAWFDRQIIGSRRRIYVGADRSR